VAKTEQIELQDPALGKTEVGVTEIERKGGVPPTPEGKIRSGRLAGLTMWQAIFVLSWPVLIESLLAATVGLVDTTLAAGLSEAATEAVVLDFTTAALDWKKTQRFIDQEFLRR